MTETTTPRPIVTVPRADGWSSSEKSPNVLKVASCRYLGRGVRLGIGYVPAGSAARQEQGGPLIPGPWAYTYPLASVIDNEGGTGAESARGLAAGTEYVAEVGDRFTIAGAVYVLTDSRRFAYPALEALDTAREV